MLPSAGRDQASRGVAMGEGDALVGAASTKAASVQAFKEMMRELFEGSPLKTRLVLKYRHADRQLCLRATDDKRTVKMRTRKPGDVARLKRVVGFVVANDEVDEMDQEQPETPGQQGGKRRKKAKKG